MSQITETLLQAAPQFADDFYSYYLNFYNENVEELGHEWLSTRDTRIDFRRTRWNTVIYRCFTEDRTGLDLDKLRAMADEYGVEVATAHASKIEAKLENVEGIKYVARDAGNFDFYGDREGRRICLSQRTVTKVSNQGTWFHQFPARIYVDGQFYSEKAYKELFGANFDAEPQPRRESFSSIRENGRYITANQQAYRRQKELKAEGIKSRVTGHAGYATISYRA